MKALFFYFFLIPFALLLTSCHHTDEPPAPTAAVKITAVDTGVVDARVRVRVSGSNTPYTLGLRRDGQTVFTDAHTVADTTILDTALLPEHTYNYKAYAYVNGAAIDSSALLTITTMDTTSHDIQWQLYTLGDGASSMLNDVAIINDTCVWAVGQIYLKDSTGQWDPYPYTVAKWNGIRWQLTKATSTALRAVFAFDTNDVWAGTSGPYHWDGVRWSTFNLNGSFNGYINKIWGTSSRDLYIVGTNGSIAHYNGVNFQKLESGTTLDIQDIWGAKNPNTGKTEILAAAGNYYVSNERKILSIKGTTVTAVSDSGISWALNSVWFMPGKEYWIAGDGVWKKDFMLQSPLWETITATTYTTSRIRGVDINDIIFCGAYGDLHHFNGVSWHDYRPETGLAYGSYHSLAIKSNLIVAVGDNYDRAVAIFGRR